ncbi:hypothetical protein CAURIS_10575 [Corynebacterium auris]|nr:hypothetical protein CAURIS_10575 [Corynebacterium auris]
MKPDYPVGYPSAWGVYTDYVDSLPGKPWKNDLPTKVSRFANRYRAASTMEVSFGFTSDTAQGYSDLLQVAMSYSTVESLEAALDEDQRIRRIRSKRTRQRYLKVRLDSPEIAHWYRLDEAIKLRKALEDFLKRDELKKQLSDLVEGGSDVRPLATGIRHLAFHGLVAPGTIAYARGDRGEVAKILKGLRSLSLREADLHFSKWVTECSRPEGPFR